MSEPQSVEDYAEQQRVEYGTYIANGQIHVNGALAYNEGDAVPASNVEKYRYLEDGLVRHVDDPAPAPATPVPPAVGEPIVLNPTSEEKD